MSSTPSAEERREINTSVPHSARIWNYWLGGKDNYAVDREAGDQYAQVYPAIVTMARTGRAFLTRAVRTLAEEAEVRQFLDIGTGLPTADNTHEIAQRVAPDCRIVYADNDPLVLAHARALLTSSPQGRTDYVHADLRDPELILRRAKESLDFERPIALMLLGVLGLVPEDDVAHAVVRRLLSALPVGSYVVVGDATNTDPALVEAQRGYDASGGSPYRLRSPDQLAAFLDGLELLEPGLVPYPRWRAETGEDVEVSALGGVGRKVRAR